MHKLGLVFTIRKSLNFEVTEEAEALRKLLKSSKDPLQHARLQALYLYKTGQCRYRKEIAEKIGYGRNAAAVEQLAGGYRPMKQKACQLCSLPELQVILVAWVYLQR